MGYGPNPNECVARLRELAPDVVLSGNHDWAVLRKLDADEFNDDARKTVSYTHLVVDGDRLPAPQKVVGAVAAYEPGPAGDEYVLVVHT